MNSTNTLGKLLSGTALLAFMFCFPVFLHAQSQGKFSDPRDGKVYNWTKAGSQVWMAENLKYNVPAGSWSFNNDSANEVNYGRLYTWTAAQAACPKGWHLPSDKEWNVLIQTLGGNSVAGERIQRMDTVGKNYSADNLPPSNAISTLLGGIRHPDGSCIGIGSWGGCWTSGKVNDSVGNNLLFARGSKEVAASTNDKQAGFSLRCIRNK